MRSHARIDAHVVGDRITEVGQSLSRCVIIPVPGHAHTAADLYWNSPFGPIRWTSADLGNLGT